MVYCYCCKILLAQVSKDIKIRKGRDIEESEEIVVLDIKTRCPSKWILIDTETGQSYKGNPNGYWDRLDPVIKE
jgi:hypothetical protein